MKHTHNHVVEPTPVIAHRFLISSGGAAHHGRWAYMKKLFLGVLILTGFLAGGVVAEEICATEQCEKALKIPNLPADVKSFVDQRDGCDHFRGEPWAEGDDPEMKERREFIFQNLKDLCTGTDRRLAELRNKYRNDLIIIELLKGYEDRIESK